MDRSWFVTVIPLTPLTAVLAADSELSETLPLPECHSIGWVNAWVKANPQARARALELLTALDVQHRARAEPSQLSGGEQQRVSIARALANRPPVILADEPTAPLDSERALGVMRILNQMAVQAHTAIIVVTHDEKIIPTFKRIYHIRDGQTEEEAGEGRSLD